MPRRLYAVLAACLFAAAPAAADPLTPEQKGAVEQLIHDYLMSHPEIIIESLKAAQQQSKQQAAASQQQALKDKHGQLYDNPDSPVGGNPQGDVTLIEFFDYRCPYCKEVEPSLEALIKADGNLRIVYKEFPILGPASVYAAHIALAARAQGKYDEFHRAMMAVKGNIDEAVILRTAAAVGLDPAKIKAAAAASDIDRIINSDYLLAEALDIEGTPTFIVGDKLVPGATDIASLRKLIAAARNGG